MLISQALQCSYFQLCVFPVKSMTIFNLDTSPHALTVEAMHKQQRHSNSLGGRRWRRVTDTRVSFSCHRCCTPSPLRASAQSGPAPLPIPWQSPSPNMDQYGEQGRFSLNENERGEKTCVTFSTRSMQACESRPKSWDTQSMPSFAYSSCSRTNMCWLKNCCNFSLVKLMQSCSRLLYFKDVIR